MIEFHAIFDFLVSRLGNREIVLDSLCLLFLILMWYSPRLGDGFFGAVERAGITLAKRKRLSMVVLAAVAILVRLSLLWVLPVPVPRVHDEFSYLLAGDTFAHGRLANPTHPLWAFFDTVHVLQHPTYMSKFPPAQGAVLAVGQLLGNPWLGVLLSVALMCAALLWALQGWLPSRWALLGGILCLLRLGISTYWINGYWGGAVAATGGALVVGALPRILRSWRTRDALLLASGMAILANSRPVEGLVLCAAITTILVWWLFGSKSPSWRVTLVRLVLPFSSVALLCGIFMGYYNWRVTGHPLLFPETLYDQAYSVPPPFVWQHDQSGPNIQNNASESSQNLWKPNYSWANNRVDSMGSAAKHEGVILLKFVYFFLWPTLCVPLLALPRVPRDHRVRYLTVLFALCFFGWFWVIWFMPHYAAPATAIFFALLVQAIRHLRRWEFRGRLIGIGLTRAVVLLTVVFALFQQREGVFQPISSEPPALAYRAKFAADLAAIPGEHLLLVRYGISSDGGEWVYNAADIDHSKIVWAREIPGMDIRPLLDYFHGRRVWVVEPDAVPPRITPYTEGSPP